MRRRCCVLLFFCFAASASLGPLPPGERGGRPSPSSEDLRRLLEQTVAAVGDVPLPVVHYPNVREILDWMRANGASETASEIGERALAWFEGGVAPEELEMVRDGISVLPRELRDGAAIFFEEQVELAPSCCCCLLPGLRSRTTFPLSMEAPLPGLSMEISPQEDVGGIGDSTAADLHLAGTRPFPPGEEEPGGSSELFRKKKSGGSRARRCTPFLWGPRRGGRPLGERKAPPPARTGTPPSGDSPAGTPPSGTPENPMADGAIAVLSKLNHGEPEPEPRSFRTRRGVPEPRRNPFELLEVIEPLVASRRAADVVDGGTMTTTIRSELQGINTFLVISGYTDVSIREDRYVYVDRRTKKIEAFVGYEIRVSEAGGFTRGRFVFRRGQTGGLVLFAALRAEG